MSSVMTFKCPCCGGYLEFEPSAQKFKCLYCGKALTEEELKEQSEQRQQEAETAEAEAEAGASQAHLRTYHCQMCGAEIVTTDTTAATRCYYCHSPVVLHDRLDDEFSPDGVIPFKLDKETAMARFREYIGKKKFVDKHFFDSAQLEMFSGVYYPFWVCDVEAEAEFTGEGTRTQVTTTPHHIVTTTSYYHVEREGKLTFRNLARKALSKADGKLTDGVHPYHHEDVIPYAPEYLSGFLAEKRDVEANAAKAEMIGECREYADSMMRSNHEYGTLRGSTAFHATSVTARYLLMPAWALTYKADKDGAPYYYMMNGATGRVCGRLPVNRGKLLAFALGVGAAVFALLCGGGALLW